MINLIRLAIINFLLVSSLLIVYPKIQPNQADSKVLSSSTSLESITTPSSAISEPTPTLVNLAGSKKLSSAAKTPNKPINPTKAPDIKPTTAITNPPSTQSTPSPTPTPPASTPTPNSPTPTPQTQGGDVASHNKQSDCWITYSGGTYNITAYFGKHPGGDAVIAQMCGKDITTVFNAVPHSSRAKQLLETYRM